jgi:Tfp pilus assembly protein PilX
MSSRRSGHDAMATQGNALLLAVLAIVAMAALASPVVTISSTASRAAIAAEEQAKAFSLAEAGLEAATYEIATSSDEAQDGAGNRSFSGTSGTYAVTSTDLGGDYYELRSTGSSGQHQVTIEKVIRSTATSRFPRGAISVVGGMRTSQALFNNNTDLVMSGNDSPGIAFTDSALYEALSADFAKGVVDGYLQSSDISGTGGGIFQPGDTPLSIELFSASEAAVLLYASLYTDVRDRIDNYLLPSATLKVLLPAVSQTYGTSSSPVTYKFAVDQKLSLGQTLSGYGTLLFNRSLIVEKGATLNWNGNLIVYGDSLTDAVLEIDGKVNVTGNILLVGGSGRNIKYIQKSNGELNLEGALTAMTQYTSSGTKAEFYVENTFNVTGLVTTFASKHQLEMKGGSNMDITGSFQFGRPMEASDGTELKLKIEDRFEVQRDENAVSAGANALLELGARLGSTAIEQNLVHRAFKTQSWRVVSGG